MPTYDWETFFMREFNRLSPAQQALFNAAVKLMVANLKASKPFHPRLRVKVVQGTTGIYEMTWDMPDGRATFKYGAECRPGEGHIHWRRIGGHEVLKQP